jgi:putative spermidine/putrescine transport system permease protein
LVGRLKTEAVFLAAPGVLLVLLLFLFPLMRILWLSFSAPVLGLQNYAPLFGDLGIQKILLTTFRVCFLTSVVCVFLGYIVSYATVHAGERIRDMVFFLILVPLWVSGLVRAFAWLMILRQNGFANAAVQWMGLTTQPLPISYNEFAVLVGMVHYMLPYAILPLYANMRDIDQQLVRAARGLGASPASAFRRVFLPMSTPGILAAASLVFIMSLGFYIMPLLLSGGRVTMIAEYIAVSVLDTANWGVASMLAVILLVAVLGLYALSSRVVNIGRTM